MNVHFDVELFSLRASHFGGYLESCLRKYERQSRKINTSIFVSNNSRYIAEFTESLKSALDFSGGVRLWRGGNLVLRIRSQIVQTTLVLSQTQHVKRMDSSVISTNCFACTSLPQKLVT
jgi:hypothetical protein